MYPNKKSATRSPSSVWLSFLDRHLPSDYRRSWTLWTINIDALSIVSVSFFLNPHSYFRKFLAHSSLVILLSQHCFWSFIQSLANTIENFILAYQFASYTYAKYFVHRINCNFRTPAAFLAHNNGTTCIIRTGWMLFSFYGTVLIFDLISKSLSGGVSTMFVITIERAVASRHFRSYERSSSRLGFGLTFVEVRWLSSSQETWTFCS